MNEAAFAAISAAMLMVAILGWSLVVRGQRPDWRTLLFAAAGVGLIGIAFLVTVNVGRAPQIAISAMVGLVLAGILLWLRQRLRPASAQARQLLVLGVLGVVFVFISVIVEIVSPR